MTDHEAILSAIASLARERDAFRAERDALAAWQATAIDLFRELLDGQPEVREGAALPQMLREMVARLRGATATP